MIFGVFERPRSTGDDSENVLGCNNFYHEDETPTIKLNVKIVLTIRILSYQSDLNSLIRVNLHLQLQLHGLFGLSEYHLFFHIGRH